MTDNNQRQWSAWYSLKSWFKSLFESEAEAVLDTFENNPPPDVGFQPYTCLLYTSPSPRDQRGSRMPSSA